MLKLIPVLLATGSLLAGAASSNTIGFARSPGDFRVDGSTVRGNVTVFDGNVFETGAARSILQLNSGQVTLAPESRAIVFRDHAVLQKGAALLRDSRGYTFQAASLRILPGADGSLIQVDVQNPARISVAARGGSVQVRNSSGVLLADLRTGMALAFDTQSGASTSVTMTGAVQARDGKYYLTDSTTNVTVELRGTDLEKYAGKTVKITGSAIPSETAAGGASQVVQVTSIQQVAGAVGAATAGGISVGTKAVIIGGVVIGGTVGGLAAAGSFSGPSDTSVH